MIVRWSPDAAADLEKIVEFISTESASAAGRVGRSIYQETKELARFPRRGRSGRIEGTRELTLPPLPFIVVYRVLDVQQTVEIVNIIHGAQRWPPT